MTLSGLIPAYFIIYVLDYQAPIQQAESEAKSSGQISFVWIEPGILLQAMLYIGCISFLFAIISMILDLRRTRL
jgi:hypothetical protein